MQNRQYQSGFYQLKRGLSTNPPSGGAEKGGIETIFDVPFTDESVQFPLGGYLPFLDFSFLEISPSSFGLSEELLFFFMSVS